MAKEPEAAAAPPVGKKKKPILLIAIVAVVLLAGGGGAAFFLLGGKRTKVTSTRKKRRTARVHVTLEPFTVNLTSEVAERFLGLGIDLQGLGARHRRQGEAAPARDQERDPAAAQPQACRGPFRHRRRPAARGDSRHRQQGDRALQGTLGAEAHHRKAEAAADEKHAEEKPAEEKSAEKPIAKAPKVETDVLLHVLRHPVAHGRGHPFPGRGRYSRCSCPWSCGRAKVPIDRDLQLAAPAGGRTRRPGGQTDERADQRLPDRARRSGGGQRQARRPRLATWSPSNASASSTR